MEREIKLTELYTLESCFFNHMQMSAILIQPQTIAHVMQGFVWFSQLGIG